MLEHIDCTNRYLGGYRITAELAMHPTCCTLLGETGSLTNRQHVVIKWFYMAHLTSLADKKSFLQEISSWKHLQHPHIWPILSAGLYLDTPYIVTPYATKSSLAHYLLQAPTHPFSQEQILSLLSKIGRALSHAHQHHIVHGNLKTTNILFNTYYDVLLTDFRLSLPQMLLPGSDPYTIDIAKTHGEQCTTAEDQYAFAALAYELFTGHKPFSAVHEGTISIPSGILLAPGQFNPTLPRHIEEALIASLNPRSPSPYQDIEDLLYALQPPPETLPLSRISQPLALSTTSGSLLAEQALPTIVSQSPLIFALSPTSDPQETPLHPTGLALLPDYNYYSSRLARRRKQTILRRQALLFLVAALICTVIFTIIGTQHTVFFPSQPLPTPTAYALNVDTTFTPLPAQHKTYRRIFPHRIVTTRPRRSSHHTSPYAPTYVPTACPSITPVSQPAVLPYATPYAYLITPAPTPPATRNIKQKYCS